MNASGEQNSVVGISRRKVLKYGLYGPLAGSLWVAGCSEKRQGKRPNVLLITLDTTRADHLSCYGYFRQTSPNLDKLAAESVLYTRAIATSSWTLPSHASLFTGKFTSSHGARYDENGPLFLASAVSTASKNYRARGLGPDELTLAGILKESGYATGAVVAGPWMKRVFGLDKGFDFYDDSKISTINGKSANLVTASAVNWIKTVRSKEFFLFLNYFDPHAPYMPPQAALQMFLPNEPRSKNSPMPSGSPERTRARYDAEILYMDHQIGRLLDKLKAYKLYESTLIIVTADHGELLGEHGRHGHGQHLWQEELHVPLFVKYPSKEVAAISKDDRAQLTDVLPMVCKRLGLSTPNGIQGGLPPETGHPVIAEVYPLSKLSREGDWRAIFDGDLKFLWNSKGNHQLFDLGDDPAEKNNLIKRQPARAEKMLVRLKNYVAKLPSPGPAAPVQQLDEHTKKALKSLGYVK